jgi:hypothetical protein
MSEVKMLKNQVFVLSCRMNDVEVEVKERWFKRRFEEVVSPLPDYPASCVIIGYSKDGSKIIDFVCAKGKLRKEMRMGVKKVNGEGKSRYMWLKDLVMNKVYTRIEFQLVVS